MAWKLNRSGRHGHGAARNFANCADAKKAPPKRSLDGVPSRDGVTLRAGHPRELGARRKSLGRSLRNKSSKEMAFPHPQSGNDHDRKEHIPSWRGVAGKFFKRAVDIAEYRNGHDEVNPANNRTLGGIFHE